MNFFQKLMGGANRRAAGREKQAVKDSNATADALEARLGRKVLYPPTNTAGGTMQSNVQARQAMLESMDKGGKVKKTKKYLVHKGERVLKKTTAQKYEAMKKQVFGISKYGKEL